ncbi:MAG: TldD/PmbA family protein [Candidatus Baltobacteraceae bacterium]
MLEDALQRSERAVEAALRAGASDAEATHAIVERFSTEARDQTIVKLEQSIGRSLSVRVFANGGQATLTTTDLAPERLDELAAEAVAAARSVAADPFSGLPDAFAPTADSNALALYADDVPARPAKEKLAAVLELEHLIRKHDPRIQNSGGSRLVDAITTTALANSRGFRGAYRSTSVSVGTNPIALDGEEKRNAAYGFAARSWAAMDSVEEIARIAAERAVGMCGARKPPTERLPVIFERDVAGSVLADVFSSLSAANVAIGNSFLVDRIGAEIGSELVTILDDGLRPAGLGSSPFDAEGVATRVTTVFERGVLKTFLYDTYYGRKLGAASTGNGAGGGIGPNNFYLAPGTLSLEALIAQTERGIFVLDTIGFATEHVTGTYSRGARGFYIENGALAYPIEEFTIASDLAAMLGAIDGVASDLRFDGAIVAPSFRIAEMTVSGN